MQLDLLNTNPFNTQRQKTYEGSYNRLNTQQKKAVDQVEGAVMVIAGPGTGKTQILAVRIAKILAETDAQAHNILCLTFTDAATIAMRRRLVQIIGPAAHQIHIYTFHGFCNQVIQENLGIFGDYRQLEPITDLEKVDVYAQIMEELPNNHILKKLKGDPTYEAKRLDNLFQMMKKENLTVDDLKSRIEDYLIRQDDPELNPKMFYRRNGKDYKVGDRKEKDWAVLIRKMDELRSAVELYPKYLKIMDVSARYDYQDMILWVLAAFKEDGHLLANYQERYQYFLVDEFQDTNGAQKAILEQLISFWSDEDPNVFVVGDDDQAIYKFQGANLSNIKDLKNKYKPNTVVLDHNYRSSQSILDTAKALIKFNKERIVNEDETLNKNLIAALPGVKNHPSLPQIKSFPNNVQEQSDIADRLYNASQKGINLGNTAIIYRKHSQVEKLVEVLEKKGVPLNIKRRVNILNESLTSNLLTILRYINAAYKKPKAAEDLLYELMHYRFFKIRSGDIARLSIYCGMSKSEEHRTSLKEVLSQEKVLKELNLTSTAEILALGENLENWISDIANVTLQVLFENIINDGHILQYILNLADKTWQLQILSTFFDLIKEEMSKNPTLDLAQFLSMIDKMKDNKISLSLNRVVYAEGGVNFLTAHASKGLEFDHVIIPGATKNIWDKNMRNLYQYTYPDNVNEDVATNTEDERRLLYVAMTRAKKELEISFAMENEAGKELGRSQFVDEILESSPLEVTPLKVEEERVNEFQYYTLLKQQKEVKLIDHDLIDKVLEGYKLSVTGLNKYLKCPLTFYFESILRIPTARTKYMGFGRAIHRALEEYHNELNKDNSPTLKELLKFFSLGMKGHKSHFTDEEYKNMMAYGEEILPKYHSERMTTLTNEMKFGLEVKVDNAEYGGVPIKGVLDKVEIHKDYVDVIDYKTGNIFNYKSKAKLKGPKDETEKGGDYWRQIVFYKILLDSDKRNNWQMTSGWMDFVEPERKTDKFFRQKIVVTPEDIQRVGQQITDTWEKINKHDFSQGCQEEDCTWCNFVKNDFIFLDDHPEDEDDIQDA